MSELKSLLKRSKNQITSHRYTLPESKGVEDIKEHIEKWGKIDLKDENIKQLQLEMFEIAFAHFPRKTGVLHPSEIVNETCERYLYYSLEGVKPDEDFVNFTEDNGMMRLVNAGSLIHMYIQWNLMKKGILRDYEVTVNDDYTSIYGSCDGETVKGNVLEIKTITTHSFGILDKFNSYESFINSKGVEVNSTREKTALKNLQIKVKAYVKQATIYGKILELKSIDLLFANRDNLALKLFNCPFDEDYYKEFVATALKIKRYKKANKMRKTPLLPKRVCNSQMKEKAKNCKYCITCFKDI